MVGRAAATLLCLALPGVLLAACLPAGDDVAPAQAEPGPSPAVADASVVEAGADGPPPPAGELLLPLGMEGIRWAEGLALVERNRTLEAGEVVEYLPFSELLG